MNIYSRIVTGLGIGSFIYLMIIFIQKSVVVTSKSIIFVFLVSLFVGITTIFFDNEKSGFNTILIIHFCCVAGFVLGLNYLFFGIDNLLRFFISLTFIYITSYYISEINLILSVEELNKYLEEIEK